MSEPLADLPDEAMRLFPHYEAGRLHAADSRAFVVGRLLEEGSSEDLRWLTANLAEDEITAWVRQRGDRQLSRRSLAFWSVVLGLELQHSGEDPLWPT